MSTVIVPYDSIRTVKALPLRQHFQDRRSRMIAPIMKQYVDKPALFLRVRADETELAAMRKRLGARLMHEDTIAVPVPDADAAASASNGPPTSRNRFLGVCATMALRAMNE